MSYNDSPSLMIIVAIVATVALILPLFGRH